jgi:hypothetical protein
MAECDVELLLVKNFKPGLLIGLDAIRDYEIDLAPSQMIGTVAGLRFPPYSHAAPKVQNVRVFTSQAVTIPGRTVAPNSYKGGISTGSRQRLLTSPQPAQGTAVAGDSPRNRLHDTCDVVKTNVPNSANLCVNRIGWMASAHWKLWWTSTESIR